MAEKKGFTLIEVIMSLFIVILAILLISKTIISSFYAYQDSLQRFILLNTYTNYKNKLASFPFESTDLTEGKHDCRVGKMDVRWRVIDLTFCLKKIELKVSDKRRGKKGYFFYSYLLKRRNK